MDLDLPRLRYFVAIAEGRAFVRADEVLHRTQPALSRQIKVLEDELGVTLFECDRSGAVLTRAGGQLLEDTRPLLAASLAMRRRRRRVRIAAQGVETFAIGLMPGVPVKALIISRRATPYPRRQCPPPLPHPWVRPRETRLKTARHIC